MNVFLQSDLQSLYNRYFPKLSSKLISNHLSVVFRRFFIYFRKQWNVKTSIVEVFATFLLLSNVKFLCVL